MYYRKDLNYILHTVIPIIFMTWCCSG